MDQMVQIEGLTRVFGEVRALDGLDLTVARGEVLGLLGPNGAGKITAVRVLATLLVPTAGRALVGGHDVVAEPAAVRALIGLTGQFTAVDALLSGRENLALFARIARVPAREVAGRVDDLLHRFDLIEAADRRAGTYSGGMRRRLDLAGSLVADPAVLFLDEPTTGLDPRSRLDLWAEVERLRDVGTTVVLTTQYLEEADRLADRIVVIDRGRVIAEGTASQLKAATGSAVVHLQLADPTQLSAATAALEPLGASRVDHATGELDLAAAEGPRTLGQAMRLLDDSGIDLIDIGLRQPSLDEVFLSLTGRTAIPTEVTT